MEPDVVLISLAFFCLLSYTSITRPHSPVYMMYVVVYGVYICIVYTIIYCWRQVYGVCMPYTVNRIYSCITPGNMPGKKKLFSKWLSPTTNDSSFFKKFTTPPPPPPLPPPLWVYVLKGYREGKKLQRSDKMSTLESPTACILELCCNTAG